jgi:hypothetical protein
MEHAQVAIAAPMAELRRQALRANLEDRVSFTKRGYEFQDAELAAMRAKLTDRVRGGDPRAAHELTTVKERQKAVESRCERSVAALRRKPELIQPDEVRFIAHALVVPSSDLADRQRHDREVERIAVRVAWGHEEDRGCAVKDVSVPAKARLAGLEDWPGFDLLSKHLEGEDRAIEVKGRAGIGDVELKENEWAKACNLRNRYWLYVVYDCASTHPRLLRIQDPFGKLLVKAKGGVVIDEREVFEAAETE